MGLSLSRLRFATGQASVPCWSAALSRALCLIHKQQQATSTSKSEGSKPRILCITGSSDVPAQYIATMNAIFSAQVLCMQHSCITFAQQPTYMHALNSTKHRPMLEVPQEVHKRSHPYVLQINFAQCAMHSELWHQCLSSVECMSSDLHRLPGSAITPKSGCMYVQRHGIVIDTCMVGSQDSAFLQQAAHISEGLYLRPKHTGALLQYLLVSKL